MAEPTTPLRVYVAGPYTADPETCTATAIEAGDQLLDAGYAPFVPHVLHYWHTLHTERHYEDWMRIDLTWLRAADAVLRLPGESPGADQEVALARELGIPVVDSVEGVAGAVAEAGEDAPLVCVCGATVQPTDSASGPPWAHSSASDKPCLGVRPRCPNCGLPHDLEGFPARLCAATLARIAAERTSDRTETAPTIASAQVTGGAAGDTPADIHECDNCEGIDPGSCLMKPDRAEPDNPAVTALARHIADHPMSEVQAAFRLLGGRLDVSVQEDGAPAATDDDLREAIIAALEAAATKCEGDCGLDERACYLAHPINWSAMVGGTTHVDGAVTAIADAVLAVVQPALDELADYRSRITWETTCGGCARTLDGAVRETERADAAEAAIARVRQLHDGLANGDDLSDPDDEITKGAAAKRIAAALDGWTPPALTGRADGENGGGA